MQTTQLSVHFYSIDPSCISPTLKNSICHFDNCFCHQSCNCWQE